MRGDGRLAGGLAALNALDSDEARARLPAVCGSRRWAAAVAAARPFGDVAALQRAADEVWAGLGADDWREAFAAHPKIGARGLTARSAREQSGMAAADEATRAALERGNRDYERRFGYIFLICAAGKSAGEMLAALTARLDNDPDRELAIAAGEQARITALRLTRLLEGEP